MGISQIMSESVGTCISTNYKMHSKRTYKYYLLYCNMEIKCLFLSIRCLLISCNNNLDGINLQVPIAVKKYILFSY